MCPLHAGGIREAERPIASSGLDVVVPALGRLGYDAQRGYGWRGQVWAQMDRMAYGDLNRSC